MCETHDFGVQLLVALVSAYRYEGPKVKDDAVKSDAKILSRVHKNNPLEDDEVIRILATRSKLHLNKLYSHYSQILEVKIIYFCIL